MTKKIIQMIVVDADGEIISAANGHVSSDNPKLVRAIKRKASYHAQVRLVYPFGREISASLDPENLIGITAALFSAKPGRTQLLEAPDEVWDWFEKEYAEFGGGCLSPAPIFKESNLENDSDPLDPMTLARELLEEDEEKWWGA